jgi:hypothetical protein
VNEKARRLKKISDERIRLADERIGWFDSAIEEIARRWRDELVELAAGPAGQRQAARAQVIMSLQQQIQGQLNRLGYEDLAREFVGGFDDFRKPALDTLAAMGVADKPLSVLDEQALQQVRDLHLAEFRAIGERAVQELSRGVLMNTVAGARRSEIIQAMTATLGTKFQAYAASYADTALMSYDRTVSWKTWEAVGLSLFLYRGPRDVKNRPFCAEHVGKTLTAGQIGQLDNGKGQPKPVSIYGGGWNCRHVWTPVVADEATASE